jgi:hypothetical protein
VKQVWVLGSKHNNVAKCVEWKPPFPNFANADVLIVNLETLEVEMSKRINKEEYSLTNELHGEARRYIFDMLMTAEKQVIIIMPPSPNYLYWLPIYPEIRKIASANIGAFTKKSLLTKYLMNVQNCAYYIQNMNMDFFTQCTNPKSQQAETYSFSSIARQYYHSDLQCITAILNVAKQPVGGTYVAHIQYGEVYSGTVTNLQHFFSSPITFLPCPTKISVESAINSLIPLISEDPEAAPAPPQWDKEIAVPGLTELETDLLTKQEEQKKIAEAISSVEIKINDKIKLRRLLWAEGIKVLEQAVKEAFIILGFGEIRKIRADNLEDWVIDFKYLQKYKHAVLEIKASEKRTSLGDLTQCNKWVEDYMLENTNVKGVFVPNQYRLEDIRTSYKKRDEFAPNELTYAKSREICILPTNSLFELVTQKLKSGDKPTRQSIEQKIADTNGLLTI